MQIAVREVTSSVESESDVSESEDEDVLETEELDSDGAGVADWQAGAVAGGATDVCLRNQY